MPNTQIVINVAGGVVQNVFASNENVEVIVVDWDSEGADLGSPQLVEFHEGGRTETALVAQIAVQSLHELAGSAIEGAIDAAYEQDALQIHAGGAQC